MAIATADSPKSQPAKRLESSSSPSSRSWYSFPCFASFVVLTTVVAVVGFTFLPKYHHHSFTGGAGGIFETQDSSSSLNNNNMSHNNDSSSQQAPAESTSSSTTGTKSTTIRIAHLGNSIQYYNDCPRLLEQMIASTGRTIVSDSCLRGGATLDGLFKNGNGMHSKFGISPNAGNRSSDGTVDIGAATVTDLFNGDGSTTKHHHHNRANKNVTPPIWEFCVMNDYTQGPARLESRQKTIHSLKKHYVPLFLQQQKNHQVTVVPIFLQTPAYRRPGVKESDDLGDFNHFTQLLEEGYQAYAQTMKEMRFPSRIAPLGQAFAWIYNNTRSLWERLYCDDDFHPSPHGTWLEACVLYGTILQKVPPKYQEAFWSRQRYQLPPEHRPLPLPTEEEAEVLRQVAIRVCGLEDKS